MRYCAIRAQHVLQTVDASLPPPLCSVATRRGWESFLNKRSESVRTVPFARDREHDSKQLKQNKLIMGSIN